MAAWNCGWCGQFGEMKPTDAWRMAPQSDYERFKRIGVAEQPLLSALFVCPRCEGASLGVAVPRAIEYEFSRAENRRSFWRQNDPYEWFPKWVNTPTYDGLPDHLQGPVKEAYETHANGFYRSSVILAPAVVEATAKDQNADGRVLCDRIERLRELELISELTKRAAHVVRNSGNDMAHGDFEEEVDNELAEATLDFMGFVLKDVYVGPAQVQAMEAKLEQSKASSAKDSETRTD